tara:strand:+ start:113 stop:1624 length:1512 start_codon:yes stop_codon:yes gene_type:complete
MRKSILFGIFSLLLTSCGGGGASNESPSPEPPAPEPPEEILYTKVIDGYVSGANIFIDHNWNLIQDDGEPSAYEDLENQRYYFYEEDFSSIDNWSVTCASERPAVAEVPVGAIDSERGEITSEYTLYHFPFFSQGAGGIQDTYTANITPLTTLFFPYISSLMENTEIGVQAGCGSVANDIAEGVINEVDQVLTALTAEFNIDVFTFYDDFIASGDEVKKAYAEKVVDFLQIAFTVGQLIEEEYQIETRIQLDRLIVEKILSNEEFETVEFAVFSPATVISLGDEYLQQTLYAFYDVIANSDGELIDSDGNVYEITLANLKANTTFLIRDMVYSNGQIFPGNRVLMETVERPVVGLERFIHFGLFQSGQEYTEAKINEVLRRMAVYRINENSTSSMELFEIELRNETNPHFIFDFETIFATRDASQLEDIYNQVRDLKREMSLISDNRIYLYPTDRQSLRRSNWTYLEIATDDGVNISCLNEGTGVQTYGEQAYEDCLANINEN